MLPASRSAALRMPSVRIARSASSVCFPANSESRPEVARRKNSSCHSRSCPWQKPSAKIMSASLRARMWGTP